MVAAASGCSLPHATTRSTSPAIVEARGDDLVRLVFARLHGLAWRRSPRTASRGPLDVASARQPASQMNRFMHGPLGELEPVGPPWPRAVVCPRRKGDRACRRPGGNERCDDTRPRRHRGQRAGPMPRRIGPIRCELGTNQRGRRHETSRWSSPHVASVMAGAGSGASAAACSPAHPSRCRDTASVLLVGFEPTLAGT